MLSDGRSTIAANKNWQMTAAPRSQSMLLARKRTSRQMAPLSTLRRPPRIISAVLQERTPMLRTTAPAGAPLAGDDPQKGTKRWKAG